MLKRVCVSMYSQQNLYCSHIQRINVDEDSYQLLHNYNHMIAAYAYINVDLTYLCWFEYPMNRLKHSCFMAWENGGCVNYLLNSLDVLPKWPPFQLYQVYEWRRLVSYTVGHRSIGTE